MRKLFTLLLAVVLAFPVPGLAKNEEPVQFDDTVLETAIREQLQIPQGEVTVKSLNKITELHIDRNYEQNPDPTTQVKSIAVLAYCKNLRKLQLNFQAITDITPLSALTKLTELELGGNYLADISPLTKLTKLEYLSIFNCQATDYSVLQNLKKLKVLRLEFSTIASLEPLQKLTKLQTLYLHSTAVTDIAPLAKLKALRALTLKGCRIADYSPVAKVFDKLKEKDFTLEDALSLAETEPVTFDDALLEARIRETLGKPEGDVFPANLATLTELHADGNYTESPAAGTQIQSIAVLAMCKNLEYLYLNFNHIADLSPLRELTKLKTLEVGGNAVTDISALAGLTSLEALQVFNCEAQDYSPLANLINLKSLSLEFSSIGDLTPLAGLSKLESLGLKRTKVTDVSPLAGLKNLSFINVEECEIYDYTPLKAVAAKMENPSFDPNFKATALVFSDPVLETAIRKSMGILQGEINTAQAAMVQELKLNSDYSYPDLITDIDVLRNFTGLTALELIGQSITDLSPLEGLSKLERLYLNGCKATDYSPLAKLQQLNTLILEDSAITDLRQIETLTNLEVLSLRYTDVTDVTPLAGFTKLFGLHLDGSSVSDYSPIRELYANLGKWDSDIVPEGYVQFSDEVLEQRVRAAMGIPEGNITVEQAQAVTKLDLSQDWQNFETSIHGLAALRYFTGLDNLSISGNRTLKYLTPLSSLTKLTGLDFCWCDVTDITPLASLKALKVVVFGWGNQVASLDALHGLENLEAIDAKVAGIKDASGLANLPKLFEVQLCENEITDVTPFAAIPNLRILLLDKNPITDFGPIIEILPSLETDIVVK